MAQTILGLDIGSYSVKVATLQASFRSLNLTSVEEFIIPHAGRSRPERSAAEVLQRVASLAKEKDAVVVTALPGDRVMTRFVTLPFDDPKRIESVLGFELEGLIPLTVGEMVYAYQPNGRQEGGDFQVFAAATQPDTIANYLDSLTDTGLDPRVLTLDTTCFLNLYDHLAEDGETIAFIDIGHRTTKVCVVSDGQLRLARSLGRGGNAVTESIAEVLDIESEEAERLKHESAALPFASESPTPAGSAAQKALRPLVVGLRQSLQSYSREFSAPIQRVFITGGGAQLGNLQPWLEKRLSLPVHVLDMEGLAFNNAGSTASAVGAKAVGLALLQAQASKHLATLNFRRGQFGYEGDFQFVRERLRSLAVLAALLVVVASGYAVVRSNTLDLQLESQKQRLSEFTKENLGKKQTSFSKTLKVLKRGPSTESQTDLFPPMTAIVVLDKITQAQDDQNRASPPGGPTPSIAPNARGGARPAIGRGNPIRNKPGAVGGPRLDPSAISKLPSARPPLSATPPRGIAAKKSKDGPVNSNPSEAVPSNDRDTAKEAEKADNKASMNRKIELSVVNIDVFKMVKVTAETHESNVSGKEEFRKRLEQEPCFTNVKRKDVGQVVSTGRHSDWVRFEVTFTVKCPKKTATPDDDGRGTKQDTGGSK